MPSSPTSAGSRRRRRSATRTWCSPPWSTIAQTLAELGADAAALEVAGLAEAQSGEMPGYEALAMPRVPGPDALPVAAERLGPMASAECKARGRAVPAGLRVLTAGKLARAHVEA